MIAEAKLSIEACEAASELYNKIVDAIGATGHTEATASIITNLKNYLTEGIGFYEKSPKSVSEWCATATPLLAAYKDKKSAGKDGLVKSLGNGKNVMENAQEGLHKSSLAMNTAGGELMTLEYFLANDFNENAKWIISWQNETIHTVVPELNKKVATIREFFEDFVCTENKITKAYRDITDLQVQAEVTITFILVDEVPELHENAIQSAGKVIEKCNTYQQKYE